MLMNFAVYLKFVIFCLNWQQHLILFRREPNVMAENVQHNTVLITGKLLNIEFVSLCRSKALFFTRFVNFR